MEEEELNIAVLTEYWMPELIADRLVGYQLEAYFSRKEGYGGASILHDENLSMKPHHWVEEYSEEIHIEVTAILQRNQRIVSVIDHQKDR